MSLVDRVVKDILSQVEVCEPSEEDLQLSEAKGFKLLLREEERIDSMRPYPGEVQEGKA